MSAPVDEFAIRPFPQRDWLELLGGYESRFVRAVIRTHCGSVALSMLEKSLGDAIRLDLTAWDLAGIEVWSFKLQTAGYRQQFRVFIANVGSDSEAAWEAWCSLVPYKGDAEESPGAAIEDLVATMIHRGDWRGPATA